jgi:aspartyl-tRNA(Asn)/glutamyl-tRNA(Gln) amidotransferase subunit A
MLNPVSPLTTLRQALDSGETNPTRIAEDCLAHATQNASHNTYLHLNPDELLANARTLDPSKPLYGLPISLKDCFDLANTVTTCGTRFYAEHNAPAKEDSAVAAALKQAGALITGKTHLHQIAYGITGENPDFGDCLQPRDPTLLTGGSSSGAVASVQEGSALAAIGTDTGGSIRVPAALCGLTGFRASHTIAYQHQPTPEGLWTGGWHLAPTFDTIGFFVRDPRDAAPIAAALFGLEMPLETPAPRIGFIEESFLYDAEPDVLTAFQAWRDQLIRASASHASFNPESWAQALEILAPIQASEAAVLHTGHFDQFEPSIAERLHWGASLSLSETASFRHRHELFRAEIADIFRQFDFLMLPCAPIARLTANADQTHARPRILRYTAPFSLAGCPVLSLPGELLGAPLGTGIQLAAAPGRDATLLAFAQSLVTP